jgi:hypothetical protein
MMWIEVSEYSLFFSFKKKRNSRFRILVSKVILGRISAIHGRIFNWVVGGVRFV